MFRRSPSSPRLARWQLEPGQVAMHDVAAGTSIVAVAGDVTLTFRDHTLAWLGADAPAVRVTIREGDGYRAAQRGAVLLTPAPRRGERTTCIVHAECARSTQGLRVVASIRAWFRTWRAGARRSA